MARPTEYDVIVIGSGSGAIIVDFAVQHGMRVALIDHGPLGGTCANVGCIPSKMIIAAADKVMEVREAARLGVHAVVQGVDFRWIMERMRRDRAQDEAQSRRSIGRIPNLDFYADTVHFVGERTLQAGERQIRGRMVFVVAGARPHIPPIAGLEQVPYLDNESVFELEELPQSLVVIGGGYIGCEYAHFFEAMGSRVTLVQRNDLLVPYEEPEIALALQRRLAERMEVYTGHEAVAVQSDADGWQVRLRDTHSGGESFVTGEQILLATGRLPNSDLLQVANAGIATDARGYIRANEYLETSAPGVWALGDVIGKGMFKHVANREATLAWHNSHADDKTAMDYSAIPHAIFTWPEVAAVGLREAEAAQEHEILVGTAAYHDVARGVALADEHSFAKAIVDARAGTILGFHVIGPHASILIQEVINVMALGDQLGTLSQPLHIHPALPEVVLRTLANLHHHHHEHEGG